jgi:hypothetical protein
MSGYYTFGDDKQGGVSATTSRWKKTTPVWERGLSRSVGQDTGKRRSRNDKYDTVTMRFQMVISTGSNSIE